jgi:hypothetical protein
MRHFLVGLITITVVPAFANSKDRSVIHHPTCQVVVKEAVNYRGSGDYTDLHGPLKGYAQSLQDSLISDLGYRDTKSPDGAIVITLRTSYADFYVHNNDGFSLKKTTSFCYVDAQSSEFSGVSFYQESRNCKKSLESVLEQLPKCETFEN